MSWNGLCPPGPLYIGWVCCPSSPLCMMCLAPWQTVMGMGVLMLVHNRELRMSCVRFDRLSKDDTMSSLMSADPSPTRCSNRYSQKVCKKHLEIYCWNHSRCQGCSFCCFFLGLKKKRIPFFCYCDNVFWKSRKISGIFTRFIFFWGLKEFPKILV